MAAIQHHQQDWKLCWLACSALWYVLVAFCLYETCFFVSRNMARPGANRPQIGTEGAGVAIAALGAHPRNSRVANTALGALSNLALYPDLKNFIGKKVNVRGEWNSEFPKNKNFYCVFFVVSDCFCNSMQQ